MKKVIVGIVVFAGIIILFGLMREGLEWMSSEEMPESYFEDYAAAKASGLMDTGWIPPYIPKTSTKIAEQHDLDSHRVYMAFEYQPDDLHETRKACEREKPMKDGIAFGCTYFGFHVTITLYKNGKGTLTSALR